jgi:hypothetical protein
VLKYAVKQVRHWQRRETAALTDSKDSSDNGGKPVLGKSSHSGTTNVFFVDCVFQVLNVNILGFWLIGCAQTQHSHWL